MTASPSAVEQIAVRIRGALDGADLTMLADLLDPQVHWGAPGDPAQSCRNRDQVLRWYRRGYADGVRSRVVEVSTAADGILVGMRVVSRSPDGGSRLRDRWQVLTVAGGLVVDIRGYEEREEAVRAWSSFGPATALE